MTNYYAPKNFNLVFFGSLAFLVLFLQIVTGIFLAMHYKPDAQMAFDSVEFIMRDVNMGWLIRYMHSTGASAFFIIIYLHMFRAYVWFCLKSQRANMVVWSFYISCVNGRGLHGLFVTLGQMSFWGAQVIINLFSTIHLLVKILLFGLEETLQFLTQL